MRWFFGVERRPHGQKAGVVTESTENQHAAENMDRIPMNPNSFKIGTVTSQILFKLI
ncbi:hypothetical protein [Chamaesiphon minutus]|uniref:hypothetical protein n=1 Tax=Chamaesiphon minutus TaxID=1173032 RepID=UPI000309084C|nr:hypothetical protein [Chamaesiphon minutus]